MRLLIFGFTIVTAAGLSSCVGVRTDRAALPPAGPVRALTAEPGVVPEGTWLVVRTNDTMNTDRAFRTTIYDARVSREVLDQNEKLLIPKESPVELGVRTLSYLGPGGAGMTELTIDVRSITVNGVRFPVETSGEPNAGGLGVNRFTAKWVGGGEGQDQVLTSGRRIRVPAQTLLAFQIEEPIRLPGYQR
jgi:hypothetical protein